MKNYLIVLFSFLSFALSAQSSDSFSDLDAQVKKMSEAYQLDQEQEEQLKLMLIDKSMSLDQFKDLKSNDKVSKTKRFEVNQSFHDALNAMTTDEQKAHYKKFIATERAKEIKSNKNSKKVNTTNSAGIK